MMLSNIIKPFNKNGFKPRSENNKDTTCVRVTYRTYNRIIEVASGSHYHTLTSWCIIITHSHTPLSKQIKTPSYKICLKPRIKNNENPFRVRLFYR